MSNVRLAVLDGYPQLVSKLGADLAAILKTQNLGRNFFDETDADSFVDINIVDQLLLAGAKSTQDPLFSLRLGLQQNLSFLGLLGYLLKQSVSVQEAILEFSNFFSLHARAIGHIAVEVDEDYASLSYRPSPLYGSLFRCNELAIAQGLIVMRALCGPRWKAKRVTFTHQSEATKNDYETLLKTAVNFGQQQNAISFPASFLDQPIPEADPRLKAILENQALQVIGETARSFSREVEELVHQLIPLGQCNVETVASHFCMHRRTLHRKLTQEDREFSQIVESVKKQIALERVEHSELSILQIADYLGYADSSAFSRAFKRWTNSTPKQWRNRARGKG